jgi:hypothetical protein
MTVEVWGKDARFVILRLYGPSGRDGFEIFKPVG